MRRLLLAATLVLAVPSLGGALPIDNSRLAVELEPSLSLLFVPVSEPVERTVQRAVHEGVTLWAATREPARVGFQLLPRGIDVQLRPAGTVPSNLEVVPSIGYGNTEVIRPPRNGGNVEIIRPPNPGGGEGSGSGGSVGGNPGGSSPGNSNGDGSGTGGGSSGGSGGSGGSAGPGGPGSVVSIPGPSSLLIVVYSALGLLAFRARRRS